MLYLAQITLRKTAYMGKTKDEKVLRLVEAESEEAADKKVHDEYDYSAPGDDSVWVWDLDLSPCIT